MSVQVGPVLPFIGPGKTGNVNRHIFHQRNFHLEPKTVPEAARLST